MIDFELEGLKFDVVANPEVFFYKLYSKSYLHKEYLSFSSTKALSYFQRAAVQQNIMKIFLTRGQFYNYKMSCFPIYLI